MNDNFTSPDFYQIDDLLSEEHKLIRESTRQWVSKSVCPIIEDYAQKAKFPDHLLPSSWAVESWAASGGRGRSSP